mgnify:FL=1
MNILITVGIFPPDIGGPATFVPKISDFLAKNGHDVKIICLSEDENINMEDELSVIRIKRSNKLPIRWLKTIYQIIKNGIKTDLIFVNGLGIESAVANLLLRKRIIRKIVGDPVWERAYNQEKTVETFDNFQDNKHGLMIEIQKLSRNWSINSAELIITPSDNLKTFVTGIGFENKIIKINNGVDITSNENKPSSKTDINIILISRLVVQKNIDLVIRAFKILDEKNLILNIVGEGGEFNNLQKLIHDLEVQDNVKIWGKIDNNKISDFLKTSDLFIQASNYEGLPHSLLEAINYNVPILSTEVGGCKDLINNGERGFIISSPPDKNLIAENISFIINNRIEAEKRAGAAKTFIKKEYNFSTQADMYMTFFENF